MTSKPALSNGSGNGNSRSVKISATPALANLLNHGYSSIPTNLAPATPVFPTSRFLPQDATFNVIVRGQVFKLNYDQLTYDQPNLFTTAFLEGFAESDSRTLVIHHRSPVLFEYIYEYLSGYAILPNPNIDLRNLVSDCEYYGFQKLKDDLTLPRLNEPLCSRHELSRVVRLEDVVSRQVPGIEWTEEGLVDTTESPHKHVLVFLIKVGFKLDLNVRANGDGLEASFSLEIPPYARSLLRSKPLYFRDETLSEWKAVMAEALSATPLTLNEGEFEGNFGDLVHWVGSFMARFSAGTSASSTYPTGPSKSLFGVQDPDITDKLSKIMPGLSDSLRARALQGNTNLKLSTSFWANDLSIIVAPFDAPSVSAASASADSGPDSGRLLVAKILNCSLTTGLYRRKCTKALVNI